MSGNNFSVGSLIPKAFSLLWGAPAKCFNSLLIKIEVKEAL
jgi:hypothetical protein